RCRPWAPALRCGWIPAASSVSTAWACWDWAWGSWSWRDELGFPPLTGLHHRAREMLGVAAMTTSRSYEERHRTAEEVMLRMQGGKVEPERASRAMYRRLGAL